MAFIPTLQRIPVPLIGVADANETTVRLLDTLVCTEIGKSPCCTSETIP